MSRKLNRETKSELKSGDILRFSDKESYEVTSVFCNTDRYGNARSVSITVRCESDGRHIYYTPASGFYGAEIIEKEI